MSQYKLVTSADLTEWDRKRREKQEKRRRKKPFFYWQGKLLSLDDLDRMKRNKCSNPT